MQNHGGRSFLIVILIAGMAATAVADPGGPQNDAGSGSDAGDVRSAAVGIGPGLTYGGQLRPNDIDWYAASFQGAVPSCISATVQASSPIYAALAAEMSGTTVATPMAIAANGTATGGVAGMLPLTATLRVAGQQNAPNFGAYSFSLARVNIPNNANDGGVNADAGDSFASALPAAAGCIGGHLAVIPTVDQRDVYAIGVPSGTVVTYSLASNYNGIQLSLTDAVGNLLGPILAPGESAAVSASSPSTFYLTAARTTAVGDVGYVVGAIIGPSPDSCKPYCLDM